MGRLIQITKIAGWVFLDDDGTVKPVDGPSDVPSGSSAFQLRSVGLKNSLWLAMSKGAAERAEAIAVGLSDILVDWQHVLDAEGDEIPFDRGLIQELPMDVLVALGMYVAALVTKREREEAARRGNAASGTSRATKRSGGTRTRGSRTASPATD